MRRFVVIGAWLVLAGALRAEILDGVAAVVNDKVITYSDVRAYVQPVVQQLRRSFSGAELVDKIKSAQMDALNNLIERALILQEFKEKGYSFPETVIDEQLNDVIASDFGGDRAAFIKTLQAENMTLAHYREQLRDRIVVQAMRNRKTQNEVVVSPYKIETYYKEHNDDFKVDEQIKLRMIFIKKLPAPEPAAAPPPAPQPTTNPVATAAAVSTNATEPTGAAPTNEIAVVPPAPPPLPPPPPVDPRKKLAEEILGKLDAGESFESLARLYSEGNEAKSGGDWGWIGRDVLRKELSDVAFTLKAGAHSQLIETPEGYYLLEVDDVKPAHLKPLAEVRDEIEKILLQQQRTKMQDNWVKQLRAKAYIHLF